MKKLFFVLILVSFASAAFAQSMRSQPLTISYLERPPYYYTDQGLAAGFLIELARNIFHDAGIEVSFKEMPPNRIMAEIQKENNFHCSVGWFKNPERETFAKFSQPIYQNKQMVILTTKDRKPMFSNHTTLKQVFADKSLRMGIISSFSYGSDIDRMIREISPAVFEITGIQSQLPKLINIGRAHYTLVAPEEIKGLVRASESNQDDFISIPMTDIPVGNKRYLMFSRSVSDEIVLRVNNSINKFVRIGCEEISSKQALVSQQLRGKRIE